MTQDEPKNSVRPDHILASDEPPQASQSPHSPKVAPLRIEDLPPPNTTRWITRRKAEVVAGVRSGLISLEEACRRYSLSVEEFLSWQTTLDRHGLPGLRVTRLQDLRSSRA